MKKENSIDIKTQVTWNTFGSFVLLFAQWGISVLLVRIADFSEAGVFSLAMTIANVFAYIGNYSTRNFMTSDAGEEYSIQQYVTTRLVTICMSFILCAIFLWGYGYGFEITWAIFFYLLYANQTAFSDVLYGGMQKMGHLEIGGIACTVKGIACFLGFMFVALAGGGLLLAMAVMALVAYLVMLFYEFPRYQAVVGWRKTSIHTQIPAVVRLLKQCFPLMLSTVIPTITVAVPRVLVERVLGESFLGIYSSIYTPTVIITTLVPSVITGIIPLYAKTWSSQKYARFIKLSLFTLFGVLGLGIAGCIAAFFFGKPVMILLFGPEIEPYFPLLYLAILATTVCALTSCGTALLTVQRKLNHTLFSAIAALIVVLVASNSLIEINGLYGAAYALGIAYLAQVIWQIIAIVYGLVKQYRICR